MGGEKRIPPRLGFGLTGSPPRGRGKGGYGWLMLTLTGITPAWAGKRVFDDAYIDFYYGSPPRRRGKVVLTEHHHAAKRITPAWAGKSRAHGASSCGEKDHPRVGGEKPTSCAPCPGRSGSPPRGRGKGPRPGNTPVLTRITPAWAGKRRDWPAAQHGPRDHPRVGGEKFGLFIFCQPFIGSPPRGRGKGTPLYPQNLTKGITPAWAGKRLKRSHRSGIFISGPIPFHSVLHRPAGSGGSRAGHDGSPAGQPQNAGPA